MANYKKIRDLAALTTITKDHLVPVSTPVGAGAETTGHTTTSNLFEAFLGGSSSMRLDSNGNLVIREGAVSAEQFEPGALESSDASVQNATSATEMADLTGAVLSIAKSNFGKCCAMVITDHPAANDIGPDARECSAVAVGNTLINCPDHGFSHPTSSTRHEVTIYSKDGMIPAPLDPKETYWAQSSDANHFEVFAARTGGAAFSLSDTGSGTIMVRRRTVFALTAGGYSNGSYSKNAYEAYWGNNTIVCLNYVFKTVEGAYNWMLRNNVGSNLVIFAGSSAHPFCHWNSPGSTSGRFAADPEFTNVNKIRITGNQWNPDTGTMTIGLKGNYLETSVPPDTIPDEFVIEHHYNQSCCQLRMHYTTGGLHLWFREAIHRVQHICFILDAQNSAADAPGEFYRSGALGQMLQSSWVLMNHNGGNMGQSAVMGVGEGTNAFMTGDTFVDYYGAGTNNWGDTITDNDVRIITTLQGGRGFLFPHGPSKFAIRHKDGTISGKVEANWLYVNGVSECTLKADRTYVFDADSALRNETSLKAWVV